MLHGSHLDCALRSVTPRARSYFHLQQLSHRIDFITLPSSTRVASFLSSPAIRTSPLSSCASLKPAFRCLYFSSSPKVALKSSSQRQPTDSFGRQGVHCYLRYHFKRNMQSYRSLQSSPSPAPPSALLLADYSALLNCQQPRPRRQLSPLSRHHVRYRL